MKEEGKNSWAGNDLRGLFDQVVSADSTPLKMRYILEGVGRNVKADRCNVHYVREPGSPVWDNIYEWCADGMSSVMEGQQGIDLREFPDMEAAVYEGRMWSFTDVQSTHPNTREKMLPQGVQSFVMMPFRDAAGSVSGCISFSFVTTHPDPIPEAVLVNLKEAVDMVSFCLRSKREQEASRQTDDILLEMGVGIWSFEMDEGKAPRMYGNKAMDDLLGCDGLSLSPEEYFHAWIDHVHPDHLGVTQRAVDCMKSGFHAEAQYPFLHPVRGEMWVRCGGRRDPSYTKGLRLIGRHEDISDLVHSQKDNSGELAALKRLADYERDRAEKERSINSAMELLVSERDFTRVMNRLTALWCRALGAQWSVLGEFTREGYRVVHSFSELGDVPLFKPGEIFEYYPELSDVGPDDKGRDFVTLVDFQQSPMAQMIAQKGIHDPKVFHSIASCHSHIVRFKGARWGSIILLFQNRHEFTPAELRFITASAHGIEFALLRRESEGS